METRSDRRKAEREGLSLWYRIKWRTSYTVLTFFGPPRLDASRDPLTRLERRRAADVAAARAARLGEGSSGPV
ncbi:hypothetical protein [Serinicoccus sp. LYQ131]|uniref:hypothetical protein n=1 Tax=Serinicoccus sp. LYQ131 TaxID=3378797 RepID=UPI003852BF65